MTRMFVDDVRKGRKDGECQTRLIIEDEGFRLMDEDSCVVQYAREQNKLYVRANLLETGISGFHRIFQIREFKID